MDLAHDHIRKNLLPRYADLEPGQMPKPRTLPGWTQSNKGVARKLLPSVMAEVEAKGDEWRNEWNFDEMAEFINKSGLLREGRSITAEGCASAATPTAGMCGRGPTRCPR